MSKRKLKRQRKAAGKAPAWIQKVAAVKFGTPKECDRFQSRGFFHGQQRADVRHFSPEEIAEYERSLQSAPLPQARSA